MSLDLTNSLFKKQDCGSTVHSNLDSKKGSVDKSSKRTMSENYINILEVDKNVRNFLFSSIEKMSKTFLVKVKKSGNEPKRCQNVRKNH